MIGISFNRASSSAGRFIITSRFYLRGKWTPFVYWRLRYFSHKSKWRVFPKLKYYNEYEISKELDEDHNFIQANASVLIFAKIKRATIEHVSENGIKQYFTIYRVYFTIYTEPAPAKRYTPCNSIEDAIVLIEEMYKTHQGLISYSIDEYKEYQTSIPDRSEE